MSIGTANHIDVLIFVVHIGHRDPRAMALHITELLCNPIFQLIKVIRQ